MALSKAYKIRRLDDPEEEDEFEAMQFDLAGAQVEAGEPGGMEADPQKTHAIDITANSKKDQTQS